LAANEAAEISEATDYYRKILPFYEKESVARAHSTSGAGSRASGRRGEF
jgi:hypothetical protein